MNAAALDEGIRPPRCPLSPPSPPSLSRSPSIPLSREKLPVPELAAHGRRLPPPFCASSSSGEQPRSSAMLPSPFLLEESSHRAPNRRHRRRFSAATGARRRRLRRRPASSGRTDPCRRIPVSIRSPWTPSRALLRAGEPPLCGHRRCQPWPWLSWPPRQGGLPCGPRGPSVRGCGSF
jgi:hypothetical protein